MDLSYLQTGISGVFFWVLNFENLYFFGYWSQLLYFFGLLNKCCILKCFIFLTVFFGSSFMYQVLQLSLFFIIIISCLTFAIRCIVISESIFRVLLFRKYFLGFSVSGKVFWGSSEIPNSADPCL